MKTPQRLGHVTLYGVDRDAKLTGYLCIAFILVATQLEYGSATLGQPADGLLYAGRKLTVLHIAHRTL